MIELEAGRRRVHVPVAAHACHLATAPLEADETARTFVVDALEAGKSCVVLAPDSTVARIVDSVDAEGIDVDDEITRGRLRFEPRELPGRSRQRFDPYGLVARHLTAAAAAMASGATGMRVFIDMRWYAVGAAPSDLLRYEAACHAVMRPFEGRVDILAQYWYADLGGPGVIDMLRLHPATLVAQFVRRNPNPADPVTYMGRLLHRGAS